MSGTIATGQGVSIFQLLAVKAAVRLEGHGMRASRGVNATNAWKKQFGIKTKGDAGRAELLVRIEKEIETIRNVLKPDEIRAI